MKPASVKSGIAGRVGETLSAYVSMRMAAGVIAVGHEQHTAAPPRIAKIGAPSAAGSRRPATARATRAALDERRAHDDGRCRRRGRPPRSHDPTHPAARAPDERAAITDEARAAARAERPTSGCRRRASTRRRARIRTSSTAPPARTMAVTDATAADEHGGRSARGALRHEAARGQRQQLAFAGRDRGAEKADPQHQVLHDGSGARDAEAGGAAQDNFEEREETIAASASAAMSSSTTAMARFTGPAPADVRCLKASRSLTREVEDVGRHHLTAHGLGEGLGLLLPLGPLRLGDLQPLLAHQRDGERVLLGHLALQAASRRPAQPAASSARSAAGIRVPGRAC